MCSGTSDAVPPNETRGTSPSSTRALEAEAFLVDHFLGRGYVDEQGKLTHPDFECHIALPIRGNMVGIVPYLPSGEEATAEELTSRIKEALYQALSENNLSYLIVEQARLTADNQPASR